MNFLFKKDKAKMNYLTIILTIFLLIYFSTLASVYFFQRSLLYHPKENNYFGDKLIVNIKKVTINTQDNIKLISWYHSKNLNKYK